ncbi:MAG: hypothetical protein DWQ40_09565 [Actinobacteria bacterium]|nr:MAG: hypothetical protein DWQ40_09565 [Actinomycetota bacterium]
MDVGVTTTFAIIAGVGAFAGLIGGFLSGADRLIGTLLMGAIGGIALSAIFALAGWPAIYAVGTGDLSIVWAAVGGVLLGFVVGRAS